VPENKLIILQTDSHLIELSQPEEQKYISLLPTVHLQTKWKSQVSQFDRKDSHGHCGPMNATPINLDQRLGAAAIAVAGQHTNLSRILYY